MECITSSPSSQWCIAPGPGGPSLRFCFMQGWGCFSLASHLLSDSSKMDQRVGIFTTVQVPGFAAFTALAICSIIRRTKLHLFLLRITTASLRFPRFC